MASSVPLRKLGLSGPLISTIGLGCWQFSQGKGFFGNAWGTLSDEEVAEIVRVSLEDGITWFDTAEAYGGGQSERALSAALKKLGKAPGDVVIATKWMPAFRTARSLSKTIDVRLKNLGGFGIDLYQIHHPISFSSTSSQMRAMARLVESGKVRHIGVSNFSAKNMLAARLALASYGLSLVSNQVHYSLLNRKIETNGVLAAAKDHGITIIAYSPLEQGLLTGKFHDDPELIRRSPGFRKHRAGFKTKGLARSRPVIDAVREVSAGRGATPAQIALAWLVQAHGDTVVAIPGATKAAQARDNAAAMTVTLTRDDLDRLNSVSAVFKN
jgi:aryl-alcohol dehydrogenase-like predicted oxidoreductase